MADPSSATLKRTSTFDSDLARLTRTFDRVRPFLSHTERLRLDWLKEVEPVVKYAQRHEWHDVLYHGSEITTLVNDWIDYLDGEEVIISKKLERVRKTASIPRWSDKESLGNFAQILYRSHFFLEYVLKQLEKHYGQDHTQPSFSPIQRPAWLMKSKSRCHRIHSAEWESEGVTLEQRFQALLTLKGPTASQADVNEKFEVVETAAATRNPTRVSRAITPTDLQSHFGPSYSHSSQSLSHRAPMGYRQNAIYYGRQSA